MQRTRALVRRERAFLTAGLRKLPLEVYEGAANFIFFRAPGITDLHRRIESRGILIRQLRQLLRADRGVLPGGGAHTQGE